MSSISTKNTTKKVWNLIHGMMGKNCGPQTQHDKRQDDILTTKQEIANTLAETFGKNSSTGNCLPAFKAIQAA